MHLEDILEAAGRIRRYVGASKDFTADEMALDAVVRNLEVIGEAAKGIPASVRRRHPEIEWKGICGLRDVLIHEYFSVDAEIIRNIVATQLPELEKRVGSILAEEGGPS